MPIREEAIANISIHIIPDMGKNLHHNLYWAIVQKGNAAEKILEVAEAANCDMIVLGAQHKRLRNTTVIGTITMKLTCLLLVRF